MDVNKSKIIQILIVTGDDVVTDINTNDQNYLDGIWTVL